MKREQTICRIVYRDEGSQRIHALGEEPIVIGRSSGCDIVLSHESISRRHAQITHKDGSWIVADLNSKNGIRVNTYRVSQQALRDEDRIDIGAIRLFVEMGSESPVTQANVIFEERAKPHLHTEVIELSGTGGILDGETLPKEGARSAVPGTDPSGQEPRRLQHLISEAAEVLLSADTLDETLERILVLVFGNLPVERGVICLYDEERDTSQPKVMRTREGVPDEPIEISTKIVNDVIKKKRALLVQDTTMDERFVSADSIVSMEIHSAMCAPLYHAGKVVGFIYVDRQSDRSRFKATHLQALSTLAALSAVAVEQAALREEIRREQEIRAHLARYSSPAVVDRIIREPGISQHMVAEEGDVTVLFADLTGFTTLSESLRPREVVQILNLIFERLTQAIFDYEGTLDKFRGDGLMAFFGAPLAMPNHAALAVESALLMQDRLADINRTAPETRNLQMRIGINSGVVTVGDIGSPQRRDYTVIGDVVNIASRLESAVAKPGQVVVGQETFKALGDRFTGEPLPEVQLKGKRHSVRPYLVTGRLYG